jgi:hypothetical protein
MILVARAMLPLRSTPARALRKPRGRREDYTEFILPADRAAIVIGGWKGGRRVWSTCAPSPFTREDERWSARAGSPRSLVARRFDRLVRAERNESETDMVSRT